MSAARSLRVPVVLIVLMSLVAAACSSSPESVTTTTRGVEVIGDEPTAPPPDPAPIMAFLWHSGGPDVVAGQPIQFTGEVLAHHAITSAELWIDGELVGETVYDEPVRDPVVTWHWIPLEADLSFALMRVYDAQGGSETTYPIWVRSHPAPTDLDTSSPDLAVGASFLGGDVGASGMAASLSFPTVAAGFSSFPLVVDEPSCTATLTISAAVANLAGFHIKASTFGMSGFVQIGLMGPAGGTVSIPLFSAPTVITADAYTVGTAVPLPPSKLPGLSSCAGGVWSGDVKFAGSRLVGGDNIDRAYLYLSTDGLNWDRYPEAPGQFVEAGVGGGFDFAGMLPKVPLDSFIEVEVWGWSGGTLVGLGRGRFDPWKPPPPSSTEMDVPFGPSGLGTQTISHLSTIRGVNVGGGQPLVIDQFFESGTICAPGAAHLDCYAPPVRMRWLVPTLPYPEHGLVQVSTVPPPWGPAQHFPGLIASAMVATDGKTSLEFALNHEALFDGGGSLLTGSGSLPLNSYAYLDAMAAELNTAPTGSGDQFARATPWNFGPKPIVTPVARPNGLWVRVIPFRDNKPIDGVTNVVEFKVVNEGAFMATPLQHLIDDIEIVEGRFYRPSPGNPGLQRCVRVIDNPFGAQNPIPDYLKGSVVNWQPDYDKFRDAATHYGPSGEQKIGLVKGSIVCAKKSNPPSKSWFEYIVDGVNMIVAAFDSMVAFINELKSDIISGVVKFTGCAPKDICIGVITALVDVALASAGVPPTLPSFDQLMQSAKGDLATMVATAAVNTVGCGGVLDAQCKKWAEELVEEFLDEIQAQVSSIAVSSAQSGGYYLWLHPDIKVIPEPAGQLFPGSVIVSFRMPASATIFSAGTLIPQDTKCEIVYSSAGFGTVGNVAPIYYSDVSIFDTASTTIDLRDMEPGQVVTVALASSALNKTPTVPESYDPIPYHLWGYAATLMSQTVSVCGHEITETFSRPTGNNHPLDYPTP